MLANREVIHSGPEDDRAGEMEIKPDILARVQIMKGLECHIPSSASGPVLPETSRGQEPQALHVRAHFCV